MQVDQDIRFHNSTDMIRDGRSHDFRAYDWLHLHFTHPLVQCDPGYVELPIIFTQCFANTHQKYMHKIMQI